MKKYLIFAGILFGLQFATAQEYEFSPVIDLEATPVISQGRTGTCWSFSTSSFLESEIMRETGKTIDLSEMYNVRYTYPEKANNYVMRQGNARFSEGGLAHDVINSIAAHGIVPNSVYSGMDENQKRHNHAEMVAVLSAMLDTYVENPAGELSADWDNAVNAVLDVYLGEPVEKFTYEGKTYTPQSFLEMTEIDPADYVTLTSFKNHPFYSEFILSIPDNFSNGSYYNVPLDELIKTIDHALKNGYTIALDIDVSEPTFSAKQGVAVIPANSSENETAMTKIVDEKEITPEFRLEEFRNFNTTDDHLMHITGTVKDQDGNVYYKVKNSWGTKGLAHDGFVYMSVPYVKLKTISILLHKDGVPKKVKRELEI
ncbi:MAG TPA: C1 family peptidase [Flavobacteriaceae bacterium]|nr:C1 family peptidase [Flavobacteriaceae bacterium]